MNICFNVALLRRNSSSHLEIRKAHNNDTYGGGFVPRCVFPNGEKAPIRQTARRHKYFVDVSPPCVHVHKHYTYDTCLLTIMAGRETFISVQWNLWEDNILFTQMYKLVTSYIVEKLTCLGSNYPCGPNCPDRILLTNLLHNVKLMCTCVPKDKNSKD